MRRLKLHVVAGCLLAIPALWMGCSAGQSTGDEQKFQEMLRTQDKDKRRVLAAALFVSGYLTNATIVVTNLPPAATGGNSDLRRAEVQRRVQKLSWGLYAPWVLRVEGELTAINVTCRSTDFARVRRAIESP